MSAPSSPLAHRSGCSAARVLFVVAAAVQTVRRTNHIVLCPGRRFGRCRSPQTHVVERTCSKRTAVKVAGGLAATAATFVGLPDPGRLEKWFFPRRSMSAHAFTIIVYVRSPAIPPQPDAPKPIAICIRNNIRRGGGRPCGKSVFFCQVRD